MGLTTKRPSPQLARANIPPGQRCTRNRTAVSPTTACDVSHAPVRRASYSIVDVTGPFHVSFTWTVATTSSPTEFTTVTTPNTIASEDNVRLANDIEVLD